MRMRRQNRKREAEGSDRQVRRRAAIPDHPTTRARIRVPAEANRIPATIRGRHQARMILPRLRLHLVLPGPTRSRRAMKKTRSTERNEVGAADNPASSSDHPQHRLA